MTRSSLRAQSGVRSLTEDDLTSPLFTQSIARALQVLPAFHYADRPLSLSEIAERAGIDRSAAQRVVHTLRVMGYIQRDEDDHGFLPGIRVLDHTLDYLRMVYAARMQSKRETFHATLVGHSVPTFCSSGGWAILARLPKDEARSVIARSDRQNLTPLTITDPDEIMAHLRETRERGYSCALQQILVGDIALGVAVTGPEGRPVAAIHVAGSLSE